MAEEYKVEQETTEQESPAVEQNQSNVEALEAAEKPVQTPEAETEDVAPEEDKNWKALREEKKRLEEELAKYKERVLEEPRESKVDNAKTNEVVRPWISQEDLMNLKFNENRAVDKIPELDPNSDQYDRILDIAVAGEYQTQLSNYARGQAVGQPMKLPDAYNIARKLKKDFDAKFEKRTAAEEEKRAKATEAKKQTTQAEGRSDAQARQESAADLDELKYASRHGKDDAIAERLVRSGL